MSMLDSPISRLNTKEKTWLLLLDPGGVDLDRSTDCTPSLCLEEASSLELGSFYGGGQSYAFGDCVIHYLMLGIFTIVPWTGVVHREVMDCLQGPK